MAREDVWIAESVYRICRSERDAIVNMLKFDGVKSMEHYRDCLLYTSPSPRDGLLSRMPSSA